VKRGANQKFPSPLSALRQGVWGEPHKKMKGKFLSLPREVRARPEARREHHHALRAYDFVSSHHARGACADQSLRDWKKVRAKVNNSPPECMYRACLDTCALAERIRKPERAKASEAGSRAELASEDL